MGIEGLSIQAVGSYLALSTSGNLQRKRAFPWTSQLGGTSARPGLRRDGVIREKGAQSANPRFRGSVKVWPTQLPEGVGASSFSVSVLRARGWGDSYPEAAGLEAGVGQGGCSNPFGAAGLCAPWAAWTRSSVRRNRVGTAGLHLPQQAGCYRPRCQRPRGLRRLGLLPDSPARGLPTGSGGRCGEAGAKRWGGQVGHRVGAGAAAASALPQPATVAHLCRDKG